MTRPAAIFWHRNDLRLYDNPALCAAAGDGRSVLPIYILDDAAAGEFALGGASRWWLHGALAALRDDYAAKGMTLLLRRGDTVAVLKELVATTGATAIHANRRVEPWARRLDERVCAETNCPLVLAEGNYLHAPDAVLKKDRTPYKVFTPYWRASLKIMAADPAALPLDVPSLTPLAKTPITDALDDWDLLPMHPDWAGGMRETWQPGEASGLAALDDFIEGRAGDYLTARDTPGLNTTSRLSPYLAFGHVSPHQVWQAGHTASGAAAEAFLRQVYWRDFSAYLLWHFPHSSDAPMNARYAMFPWRDDAADDLHAWERGRTGYPLVDAGQRQLWQTGWQHNRVRLVTSSFLVKHLLVSWRAGAAWFWDTLVDADLGNNTMGWQWIAGSGADASPYFRIFNPVAQSRKFDARGDYIRRYVPELAKLPNKYIHAPWTAPQAVLDKAGIVLGKTYPRPVVTHETGRTRALDALREFRLRVAAAQETKGGDQDADQ